jgi:hypothetical protein
MADPKKPSPFERTQRLPSAPDHPGTSSPARDPSRQSSDDLVRTLPLGQPNAPPPQQRRVDVPRGIELLVVEETELSSNERRPWRAAELWTKRRVYGLDSTFRCIEVLDRESGRLERTHDLLGAQLGGGRLRERDTVRFSYPLPLPGMEAMFMKGKTHGYTSPVERMVVRVRVLQTSADEIAPTWEDIANRWSDPPTHRR